jgi:hypothetical protein
MRERRHTPLNLGKDPQIPQMRDLRGSCKGIFEFYLKILQNSEIIVD